MKGEDKLTAPSEKGVHLACHHNQDQWWQPLPHGLILLTNDISALQCRNIPYDNSKLADV